MIASPHPNGWLAFRLNVLRRRSFGSVLIADLSDPALGVALKRSGTRVIANSTRRVDWMRSLAAIQNTGTRLSDDSADVILDNAYRRGDQLSIPHLHEIFGDADAWWFDNTRRNLEQIDDPFEFAVATDILLQVGEFARSFDAPSAGLRQPLSIAFRRIAHLHEPAFDNGVKNSSLNLPIDEFLQKNTADVLFLSCAGLYSPRANDWRAAWLAGASARTDMPSATPPHPALSKSQILGDLKRMLGHAAHTERWAIEINEPGPLTANDVTAIVSELRPVTKIYTKDLSELTGIRTSILLA